MHITKHFFVSRTTSVLRGLLLFGCFTFLFAANGFSQIAPKCDSLGRIDGIFYTDCFLWQSSDGTLILSSKVVNNDTPRLQRAINNAYGKLIFNESDYYVNDTINLYSYRTLVGTGREVASSPVNPTLYLPSKIVQTASNKAIFKIGGGINAVAIRDLGFTARPNLTNTVGILAENGNTEATSDLSTDFEFTNVTFNGLTKGIYVNAQAYTPTNPAPGFGAEGFWRFDNVKLDHARFHNCRIGVQVNSKNSGWSMKNLFFTVPDGAQIPEETAQNPAPVNSSTLGNYTFGMYLQRIGYSTIDTVIGDGPLGSNVSASALIYVGEHANLNIHNTIDEVFKNSIYIFGGDINSPITLINNTLQSPLRIRNSWVVSMGNQFPFFASSSVRPAAARTSSKVYSIGDKFCLDYIPASSVCTESTDATYDVDASSQLIFSSNSYRNTMTALRLGPVNYHYDIVRNGTDGLLDFIGVQGSGVGGGNPAAGYSGYRFQTPGGTVKINYDGSVSYGSKTYSDLISYANLTAIPSDGTVIYCSNCQKTTPCSSGGNGALAKKINGSWDCD